MMCVRQLLLAAMVHDASASIARHVLPVIQRTVKRRLQFPSMDQEKAYSAECLQACPAVDAMQKKIEQETMAAMLKNAGAMQNAQSGESADQAESMAAMGKMMEDMVMMQYSVMCESKEAMTCLSDHADVCAEGENDAAAMLVGGFDCMCTACPCLQTAMGGMTSMMMTMLASLGEALGGGSDSGEGSDSGAAAAAKMMGAFCQMAPAFACIQRETTCSGAMESAMNSDEGGIMSMFGGGGGNSSGLLDQNADQMGEQCAALGHDVDMDKCSLAKEDEDTSGAFAPSLTLMMLAGVVRVLRLV